MQPSATPIDIRGFNFISYAPRADERQAGAEEARVSVESEIGDALSRVRARFPLRPGKIQRPLLPGETLPRDRLFSWLDAHANRRLTYVIAEAGFGKTTLVADFLRRSRLRTFWYRLDEDDTDGLVFIRYFVAACQAVDNRLLARSASLLAEPALEPTPVEILAETVFSELGALGEMPSVLVLDDFHMVEAVPAIGALVERLIARAPAGLRVIVASRRTPNLSVAALRARGELAELDREELRFDESETGRLFRDSYNHPLEPDVLRDLQARTDGWAASLQLVNTAVIGRSPGQVRAFVGSLSGAEGDLYDYLAEEVVGDLEPELRGFLVRTSILEDIDPATAAVAASVSPARARRLLGDAQRAGLMTRGRDLDGTWRPHPLVREFLLAHLEAELGESGVSDLHRRLAAVMEPRSWRMAARHWAAAGDPEAVRRVICAATPTIVGTGDLAAAYEFVSRYRDAGPNPWFDIIESRLHAAAGRYDEAVVVATRAEEGAAQLGLGSTTFSLTRALNRLHLGIERHDMAMLNAACLELAASGDLELASIARAATLMGAASEAGSLDSLCEALAATARLNHDRGHRRHEGISLLNLAFAEIVRGNHDAATSAAGAALALLESSGNSADIASARIGAARGLAHLGRWDQALDHLYAVAGDTTNWVEPEAIAEAAEMFAMYGDPAAGKQIMERRLGTNPRWADHPYWRQVSARLELALGFPDRAEELLAGVGAHPVCPGFACAVRSLELQIRTASGAADPALLEGLTEGLKSAERQQAWFWWKNIRLTQALVSGNEELLSYLASLEQPESAYLSIQAELVARRLADLDQPALDLVRREAGQRPERWRRTLRDLLARAGGRTVEVRRAAEILETVGDRDDVGRLRSIGKRRSLRLPDAGRGLIRRLAPRVYVEDLGRVSVQIGDAAVAGTAIRRKVLSLLCFLLTKPQFTATREQALDALWPEMDPEAGANSLNQSAYFLRRVLEPECQDDTSAGYLRSRSDLIWLDGELVGSRSADCLALLGQMRRDSSPDLVVSLAESYRGRFAVDFIYDDWASSFRDTLHASFLDRMERAITLDTQTGAFDRALSLAQLTLQADPDAEQIELCLLRLYRRTNATAAAAEQYVHYAGVMREQLGVEPPPLDSI